MKMLKAILGWVVIVALTSLFGALQTFTGGGWYW